MHTGMDWSLGIHRTYAVDLVVEKEKQASTQRKRKKRAINHVGAHFKAASAESNKLE